MNVDINRTAGEDITAGEHVGLWGTITDETDTYHDADEATYVDSDNAATNYDGTNPMLCGDSDKKRGLVHFPGMAATPSATGLIVLKWYVRFKFNKVVSGGSFYVVGNALTSGFDETTVTWNSRPTIAGGGTPDAWGLLDPATGTGSQETAWIDVGETLYNNIRNYGIALGQSADGAFTNQVGDEDDGTQVPTLKAKFDYEIQNGKAWLVDATETKYANSYLGVAMISVSAEANIRIRTDGIADNQAGLTPYADYQIDNTEGTISEAGGTSKKVIGRALSATELQIKYALGDAT